MASIVVTSNDGTDSQYQLPRGTVVIGRGEQLPIQILDKAVSEKHLQIRFDDSDNAYHALDMKSKNGTRVNGREVSGDVTLAHGDVIEIGQARIRFYERDEPEGTDAFKHPKQLGERDKETLLDQD